MPGTTSTTIRTRGGSGILKPADRLRVFVRNHPDATNPRGLAKMFKTTVAEARAILAEERP